jgi:hypothetical protein
MAGMIKLNAVAASMIPAAIPSKASISFFDILRVKKMGTAPAPVANPAAKLAIMPMHIICV